MNREAVIRNCGLADGHEPVVKCDFVSARTMGI